MALPTQSRVSSSPSFFRTKPQSQSPLTPIGENNILENVNSIKQQIERLKKNLKSCTNNKKSLEKNRNTVQERYTRLQKNLRYKNEEYNRLRRRVENNRRRERYYGIRSAGGVRVSHGIQTPYFDGKFRRFFEKERGRGFYIIMFNPKTGKHVEVPKRPIFVYENIGNKIVRYKPYRPKKPAPLSSARKERILAELKKYEGYRGYRELEKYKRYNNNYY